MVNKRVRQYIFCTTGTSENLCYGSTIHRAVNFLELFLLCTSQIRNYTADQYTWSAPTCFYYIDSKDKQTNKPESSKQTNKTTLKVKEKKSKLKWN